MKRELTFEEFSKSLEGMENRCGSCKFLEHLEKATYCEKHDIERSNKDPKCSDWRYFA